MRKKKELFNDLSIEIGKRIKDLIDNEAENPETFMTQRKLGIKMEEYIYDNMNICCEINDNKVSRLLSGTTLMPAIYLLTIAKVLGVSADYLLGETNHKNYTDTNEIYLDYVELLTVLESAYKSRADMYIQESELIDNDKKAFEELHEKQCNEQKELRETYFENMEAKTRIHLTEINKQYKYLQNKYGNIKK